MHAVIFTGGEAPLPQNTAYYFAGTPPIDYIVAADSGLDTLEAYRHFYGSTVNFKPNFILGDMDSLKDKSLLEKYSGVKSEIYNRDKDYTDTELALMQAVKVAPDRDNDTVTLIGGSGGLMDHCLGVFETFAQNYHADVWLTKEQVVCCLEETFAIEMSNLTPKDRISIARAPYFFTGGKLKSEGLAWESPGFRESGMPSISNRIAVDYYQEKRPVKLMAQEGRVLVFIPFHTHVHHPERLRTEKKIVPGVVDF